MKHQNGQQRSVVRGWLSVAAITASLFVFLTTELMPVGLLTPMSASLGVPVGVAGLMVTLYGVSAGLGVPFIVAWTRRVDRRLLLSALLVILTLGNLITSISPSFVLILSTRLVMGFANGVFWAIGVGMAMRSVPERHSNLAAAVVMSGISIATVLGLPLGTLLEGLSNWRTTFLVWAGLGAAAFLAVTVLVPQLPSSNAVSVRDVFRLPVSNLHLRRVLCLIVLFVLGHFGAYTFVRPFLEAHTSATAAFITGALVLYGAGGAIGNFVAGHTAKKNLRGTFVTGLAGLSMSLLVLLSAGNGRAGAVVSLVLWGICFGAVQLCQVNLTLAAAPEAFEAAMSLNTMAYNTSIAVGALLGGLLTDSLGVTSVVWFGIALTGTALLLTLTTGRSSTTAAIQEQATHN